MPALVWIEPLAFVNTKKICSAFLLHYKHGYDIANLSLTFLVKKTNHI